MPQTIALGTEAPNVLGAFQQGVEGAAKIDAVKQQNAEKVLQLVGSASMYALNGDINGQADPAKFEEALNGLQNIGIDVSSYRGKPQFANVAARASVSTLQQLHMAQNQRQFDLSMEKFEREMTNSDRAYNLQDRRLDIAERAAEQGNLPSGYRRTNEGALEPVPGGPADPANPLNTKKVTGPNLSPTAQKELFEADEGVQAGQAVMSALDRAIELNSKAYSGPMAESRGYGASLVGIGGGTETEELKNLVTSQALDQLKQTFGSMPTEGERKILLDIQGSVNQAPQVREAIYKRAKAAAERRIGFAKRKAASLRSGEYFSEGPGDAQAGGDNPSASATKGATTRTIDGKTYEQDSNGDWFEVE